MGRYSFLRQRVARIVSTACVAAGALAVQPLSAAQLQISQVADTQPSLTVFISSDSEVRRTADQPSADSGYTAALGNLTLPVKSTLPYPVDDGIALVIALDVSASLGEGNFSSMKNALASLLAKLPAKSQVALMAIGNEAKRVHEFTKNQSEIVTAVGTLQPDAQETALYESVISAQEMAARADPALPLRRAVLVITDGIDDSRRGFGREEALQKISVGDVPLLAIAVSGNSPSIVQRDAIKTLAQIARASGGGFQQVNASGAKAAVDELVMHAFKVGVLTLDCATCPRDGSVRRLQISFQQGNLRAVDSRDVRLLTVAPAVPVSKSENPVPTAPDTQAAGNGDKQKMQTWIWVAVALALALLAAAVFAFTKRRTNHTSESDTHSLDIDGFDLVDANVSAGGNYDGPDRTVKISEMSHGKAITLDVAGKGRVSVSLGRGIVIGRGKSVDVQLSSDIEASTKHASLHEDNGIVVLRDLGSTNGTFLNGTKIIKAEPVGDRDCILIGRTEIRVYF